MTLMIVETAKNKKFEVIRKDIEIDDEEWFIREFKRSFMFIYANKTFYVTMNGQEVLVGPGNFKEKEKSLLETAKDEFNDYVVNPKLGYKAIAGWLKNIPIGTVLYRELKDENTIYLAQGFVIPEMQKNGIGSQLLIELIKQLSIEYKTFEVNTRHQNDAAFALYQRIGFKVGEDATIVLKYGYNPMRYVSFYKYFEHNEQIDLNALKLKRMEAKDKEWFLNESKKIYKNVYDKKTFFIENAGIPVQLLSSNKKEKDEWIANATNSKFVDYVETVKDGYKAYVVNYKDSPVGVLLYILLNNQLLTITELLIISKYQKKGFGLHIVNNLIPKLHPQLKQIEALVRPQNEIALSFLNKAGFTVSGKILNIYQIIYQKTLQRVEQASLQSFLFKKLEAGDEDWFSKEYAKYLNNVYKNKTLLIAEGTDLRELKEQKQKIKWFLTKAKQAFHDCILTNKDRQGVIIEKNGAKCGAITFEICNKKTIFFDQFFVSSDYIENASEIINSNLFEKILTTYGTDYLLHSFNAVVQQQNDFDSELLLKADFVIGNRDLVKKYNYNPYLYRSFYKVIVAPQTDKTEVEENCKCSFCNIF